jgi:alpha-glucosidase
LEKPAPGYQALGKVASVARDGSKVCLSAGSATVEVTALAPDLFRVGFFPQGRAVDYSSVAVVAQDWQPGPVAIVEAAGEVTLSTSAATVRIALDPLRIGFTDLTGRAFAFDDAALGMGWFTPSGQDQPEPLGAPVRVYKQHLPGEHYFGCGERTGELDKTGSQQMFWNVDPPRGQTALQSNLYASIPFTLVLSEGRAWGLFLDSTTLVDFDLAHADPDRAWFGAGSGDLVYYVFCGPTPADVVARYTDLTGHTPLPPVWALGAGQSRFSYETAEEVRQVARSFRERDIPCDSLYLDIDTLDGYRVFTWNPIGFPDPEGLLAELKEMGFHAVSIVDAGVKVDERYSVYKEGVAGDLFCKTSHGDDY